MPDWFHTAIPEWIFFDCFNTLIDDFDDTGDESGLGPMLHVPVEAGFYVSEIDFKKDYDEWRKREWRGDEWHEVELPKRLRTLLKDKDASRECEIEVLVKRMLSCFNEGYPRMLRLTPGVREMLQAWHGKVKMGVVSNFFLPEWPKHLLAKYGLANYFDFVLGSAAFGIKKPGLQIYFEALRLAGIPRNRVAAVLFIGDSLTNDVLTPRALNMSALYFDRSAERPSSKRVSNIPFITHWDQFRPEKFKSG
ncbi:HAD family hydrolase [Candidatus Poribacteria bacterium]|nr:HAD family hydrolase [Candidatus Poribacteria bacterium]